MAEIFDRDHLPMDKLVQSKLIRWLPLHSHVCGVQHSSATDIPFKHYTAEIRRKPPTHPRRILGLCILTIGEPIIMMLTESCGVSAEKNKQTNKKNRTLCKGFQLLWWIFHLIWSTESRGKRSAHSSRHHLFVILKKKTFYTWAFTSILG